MECTLHMGKMTRYDGSAFIKAQKKRGRVCPTTLSNGKTYILKLSISQEVFHAPMAIVHGCTYKLSLLWGQREASTSAATITHRQMPVVPNTPGSSDPGGNVVNAQISL